MYFINLCAGNKFNPWKMRTIKIGDILCVLFFKDYIRRKNLHLFFDIRIVETFKWFVFKLVSILSLVIDILFSLSSAHKHRLNILHSRIKVILNSKYPEIYASFIIYDDSLPKFEVSKLPSNKF